MILVYFFMCVESRDILNPDVLKRMVARVQKINWCNPSLKDLTFAAVLAHNKLITKLSDKQELFMWDLSLASISTPYLTSLISCVTGHVSINNLSDCLDTILDSVKSTVLSIRCQNLSSDETKALVRALELGVQTVRLVPGASLYGLGYITLDIEALTMYSGQGRCREIVCAGDVAAIGSEKLRTWAKRKGWEFTKSNETWVKMKRNS